MTSESRKRAWTKYNRSEKKRRASKKYYEAHKEACLRYSIEWQKRNREHVRALERKRNHTAKGRQIRRAIEKRYCEKNRIKRLAKDAVHNAIRAGKLKKLPCVICGCKTVEAHHPDYTKPLKVMWVCKKDHKIIHKYGTNEVERPK